MIFLLISLVITTQAVAQDRTLNNLTEAQLLGITAGTALACNAGGKLDDFELIANRYISNQAMSDADEKKGYKEYAEKKIQTYREQKNNPQLTCGEVLDSFNQLPIFKTIVYADGSIKTPEGKIIKVRKPIAKTQKNVVKKSTSKTPQKTASKNGKKAVSKVKK